MNNKQKGLLIAGIILFLTLGVATVKILTFAPQGTYWGSTTDLLLVTPALPFLTLIWAFPDAIGAVTGVSFILATIFWLIVAYFIGAHLDKKKK